MKPPHLSRKSYGNEKSRIVLARRLIPASKPVCDICDCSNSPDFHILMWDQDDRECPIIMCRRCAVHFMAQETDIEIGYVSHVDLVETGLKEFVVFEGTKREPKYKNGELWKWIAENEKRSEQRFILSRYGHNISMPKNAERSMR